MAWLALFTPILVSTISTLPLHTQEVAEVFEFTDYECLPPGHMTNLAHHLRAGSPERALPWITPYTRSIHPDHRLIFQQGISFESIFGRFVYTDNITKLKEWPTDALTVPKFLLNRIKDPSRQEAVPISQFAQKLTLMNEHYHLFRVPGDNFEAVSSVLFRRLVTPGALVFTNKLGAVVLSADWRLLSICPPIDQYLARTPRTDWPFLERSNIDTIGLIRNAVLLVRNTHVREVLLCDELLTKRVAKKRRQ